LSGSEINRWWYRKGCPVPVTRLSRRGVRQQKEEDPRLALGIMEGRGGKMCE
jgi:hypothetical protein